MALIKCTECGREISNNATSCHSCGIPIQPIYVNGKVETERTNKKWKKRRLLGILFLFIGLLVMSKSIALGLLLMFVAIIIAISANTGEWWNNG